MPWFSRLTRFGDVHFVYSQAAENSCGIASVMMCVFKVNKLLPATAVHKEEEVYRVYGNVSGATYDGSGYSYANHLASTLNRLNCGNWQYENVGPENVASRLVSVCGTTSGLGPTVNVSPVIVLIGWDGGGAHFVVVDTVRSMMGRKYATVCDPWDAQLRVTHFRTGNNFNYSTEQTIQWNMEGTPQHEYGQRSNGVANGWVIHQRQ